MKSAKNSFFLTSQLHGSCRIFVLYKWQGRLFISLNIFFTAVLSFGKRCYFLYQAYWIFWHLYSYWVLATVVLTSLSKLLPGKWPRALSYIHDSSSLACRNSYCVHHRVSNSLLPLTVFGRESCWKLCYPLELITRFEILQYSFRAKSSNTFKKLRKAGKRFV